MIGGGTIFCFRYIEISTGDKKGGNVDLAATTVARYPQAGSQTLSCPRRSSFVRLFNGLCSVFTLLLPLCVYLHSLVHLFWIDLRFRENGWS